jgi:iron complex transport system substrate-binding protein
MSMLVSGCGKKSDIVSLAPELTEIVIALGEGGRLQGISQLDDHTPELETFARMGTAKVPDLAAIEAAQPKLILTTTPTPELQALADSKGISLLGVPVSRLDEQAEAINAIATALGRGAEATELNARLTASREELTTKLADKTRPKVLIVTGRDKSSVERVTVAAGDSLASDLVNLAAGSNAFADKTGGDVEVSLDEIRTRAPEVILELLPGMSLTDNQRQALYGTWNAARDLPALSRGAIFYLTEADCLRPGPGVIDSAATIAKTMHGNYEWDLAQGN